MRLALKLSLLLAAASAGPLVLATASSLPLSRAALRLQLQGLLAQSAQSLAQDAERTMGERLEGFRLTADSIDFAQVEKDTREYVEQLVFKQTKDANAVVLLDSKGQRLAKPTYYSADTQGAAAAGRELMDAASVQLFEAHVPIEQALNGPTAMSPVYVSPGSGGAPVPRVAVAVAVQGEHGQRWILAAELSLISLTDRIARFRLGETGRALLVDGAGLVIAHSDPAKVLSREDLSSLPVLKGQPDPDTLGATAPVKLLGWKAAVVQSSGEALAPLARQEQATYLFAGLGLAAAFGLGFTAVRAVTRPLGKLRAAAAAIQEGRLETAVAVAGKDELAQLGAAFNTMARGLQERERLKTTFSRYVSAEIAARILRESNDLDLKGEAVEVTVVFIDVRGFTSLSEKMAPRLMVELLNDYFEQVAKAITEHQGVINKFIGDAVMAVFGVPREIPQPERRAVLAALRIQALTEQVSQERRRQGLQVAHFGIGVNTGSAIAGNLGSSERMEYTVIGDAVNVAQRLQVQAREGEVVVSASTLARAGGDFRVEPRGEVMLKGKKLPVEIFRIGGSSDRAAG